MENNNTQEPTEHVDAPTAIQSADKAENTSFVREMLSVGIVPAVGWCTLCTYVLWDGPHWFLSIAFGCLAGLILFFVSALGSAMTGNGTTLVELSVGSFITLILAVILVPVFIQARDKARQQRCADNVRALSQALTLYAQDNDGYFLMATTGKPPRARFFLRQSVRSSKQYPFR